MVDPTPTTPATPAPAASPAPQTAHSAGKDWLAFFTYFFPIVLIYTMLKHGSEKSYLWHSKNAAGGLALDIALQVLVQVLWRIVDFPILFTVLNLCFLALFILMVFGGWQAANGKEPSLPLVTQIGQKIPLEKWFHFSAEGSPAAVAAPEATAPAPVQETPAAPVATPMPEPTPVPPAAPEEPAPEASPTAPVTPEAPAPATSADQTPPPTTPAT